MNSDPRAREQKKILRKMGNPLWGFLWRFLVCCMLIELPLWAYFHFVKGVPVLVGLQQIQNDIKLKMKTKKVEQRPFSQTTKTDILHPEKKAHQVVEQKEKTTSERQASYVGTIYSWTNQNGIRSFSNVGFPKDEVYTNGKTEQY